MIFKIFNIAESFKSSSLTRTGIFFDVECMRFLQFFIPVHIRLGVSYQDRTPEEQNKTIMLVAKPRLNSASTQLSLAGYIITVLISCQSGPSKPAKSDTLTHIYLD